jgi:hypothetical protein
MVKIDDVPFAKGGTLFRKSMLALYLHSHLLIVAIFISNGDAFLSDISNSFLTANLAYYCLLIFRPSLGLSHARYAPYEARHTTHFRSRILYLYFLFFFHSFLVKSKVSHLIPFLPINDCTSMVPRLFTSPTPRIHFRFSFTTRYHHFWDDDDQPGFSHSLKFESMPMQDPPYR